MNKNYRERYEEKTRKHKRSKFSGESSFGKTALWILQSPFQLLAVVFTGGWKLLVGWTMTRHGRSFLLGLPALLVMLGTIGLLIGSQVLAKRLQGRYAAAYNKSFENEDYSAAKIYLQKRISLDSDKENLFKLAELHEQAGEKKEANTIFASLAPLNNPGLPKAQMRAAIELLKSREAATKEERAAELTRAQMHIDHVIARGGNKANVRVVAANIALARGRPEEAETQFTIAAHENKGYYLSLAKIQLINKQQRDKLGTPVPERDIDYIKSTKEFLDYVESLKAKGHKVNVLHIAQAHLLIQEYEKAIKVLKPWLSSSDKNIVNEVKRVTAGVYAEWAKSIQGFRKTSEKESSFELTEREEKFSEKLEYVTKSLELYPNNPMAIETLAKMTFVDNEHQEDVNRMINRALVEVKENGFIHMLMGNSASAAGDHEAALLHFEQAQGLTDNGAYVLNNLAWSVAHREEPDYDRAIELINNALKVIKKENPHLFQLKQTKGTILLKMGEHKKALVELGEALKEMPEQSQIQTRIHSQISEAYEKLNKPELAEIYKGKAEELQEKARKEKTTKVAAQRPID